MKFFTIEWWSGCQSGDSGDAIRLYQSHLAAIRHELPPDLLALQESVSLHDANLLSLSLSCAKQSASLRLQIASGEQIELHYSGVQAFESIETPDRALGGAGGYGDLGYDEVDVLPSGLFEHCILFSSSVELQLRFRSMALLRHAAL